MKKILDKNIHLRHTELAPPPKDDTVYYNQFLIFILQWDKSVLDQNKVETYVPEEKVQEYETHFPALGEEPIAAKNVETEFSRDILKAEEKFAVEAENVEPVFFFLIQYSKL